MDKRGQESFAVSPSDSNSNMDDEITFSSNDVDAQSASSNLQQNPVLPSSSATKVLQPALNRNSIVRNQKHSTTSIRNDLVCDFLVFNSDSCLYRAKAR